MILSGLFRVGPAPRPGLAGVRAGPLGSCSLPSGTLLSHSLFLLESVFDGEVIPPE